jgi:hypothetical protein
MIADEKEIEKIKFDVIPGLKRISRWEVHCIKYTLRTLYSVFFMDKSKAFRDGELQQ